METYDFINDMIKKLYMIYPFTEIKYKDSDIKEYHIDGYIEVRFFYMGEQRIYKRCIDIRNIETKKDYRVNLQATIISDIQRAITNLLLEGVENEIY